MRTRSAQVFSRLLPLTAGALLSCATQSSTPKNVTVRVSAVPSASATAPLPVRDTPAPPGRRARYAPRPSREGAMFMEQRLAGPLTAKGRLHGPVANNFEIHPTASLGNGATGVLDRGRRFIASGDTVRAVDAPAVAAASSGGALDGVLRVADALGGGFVFYTEDAVFYTQRFDAPLTRLGSGPVRSFIIGVKCVFLRMADGTSVLLQLADGAPIAGMPADVAGLRAHPNGFMVGLTRGPSGPPTHLYFTK
ncbi:MAG TPA: hypothetical protein VLT33_16605, partial [Labilithrix sp.]|nr:hypothetical protein [Labilithrix sp.]